MSAAEAALQKSLILLDHGEPARGEEFLGRAIHLAEEGHDDLTLVRALCCLGDFLHDMGRDEEATPLLKRVAAVQRDDDLLSYEVQRAKALLATIAAT